MAPIKLLVILSVIVVPIFCRQGKTTWADFKDSPYVVDNVRTLHGDGRRARFTGENFAMSREIRGEREYRVHLGHAVGMETALISAGERDLFYREVSDGKKLIKSVYGGTHGLIDCDVEKDKLDMDKFLAKFLMTDLNTAVYTRRSRSSIDVSSYVRNANGSFLELNNKITVEPYATLADVDSLHQECIQFHHAMKHKLKENGVQVDLLQSMGDEEDQELGESEEFIPRRVKRVKRSTLESKTRSKRNILVPDTNWCGMGTSADEYEQVGPSRATDRCCREHDSCPYFIEGFSSGYNLFNYYFHTISHCFCDETFRTCLKIAGTDKAEMVGSVYFQVLGMKCFEFETEEVCTERSFWGRCTQTEEQVVARIRGSLDWN